MFTFNGELDETMFVGVGVGGFCNKSLLGLGGSFSEPPEDRGPEGGVGGALRYL